MPARRSDRHATPLEHPAGPRLRAVLAATGRLIGRDSFPQTLVAAAADIQHPIATGRRIVVCSPSEGSGASTVGMGLTLAVHTLRDDLVATIDLAESPGGPRGDDDRPALTPATALGALAVNEPATRDDFRRTMRLQPHDDVVIMRKPPGEADLNGAAVHALVAGCTRHCGVTVVVTPPGLEDARTVEALASAHAAVVVTDRHANEEGVARSFVSLLRHLHPNLPFVEVMNEPARLRRRERRELGRDACALRHAPTLSHGQPTSFASLRERETAEILTLTARAMRLSRAGRIAVEGGSA